MYNDNDGNRFRTSWTPSSLGLVSAASAAPQAAAVSASSLKSRKKSSTLTREADPPPPMPALAIKPQVPAKPAHIRPGLKPVKIPTVDDKVWVSCF